LSMSGAWWWARARTSPTVSPRTTCSTMKPYWRGEGALWGVCVGEE
jgi:hypothetical protein